MTEHVFFPGGRRNPLTESWEACLRKVTPILSRWNADDIREMLDAVAPLDDPRSREVLLPLDLKTARRLRDLCRRALDRGNLERASRLMRRMIPIIETAMRVEDIGDAIRARRFSTAQSRKGHRGAEARWNGRDKIKSLVRQLAGRKDPLGDPIPPSELWPELFDLLGREGFEPRESGGPRLIDQRYALSGADPITYDAFRQALARARRVIPPQ